MLASVVCLVAPNIAVLGVGRVLQGIGVSAAMVVAIAVVGDCSMILRRSRCCRD
jgi:DHA1 family bicyclomycin/chloramphenicol resistance-like MFS transporter